MLWWKFRKKYISKFNYKATGVSQFDSDRQFYNNIISNVLNVVINFLSAKVLKTRVIYGQGIQACLYDSWYITSFVFAVLQVVWHCYMCNMCAGFVLTVFDLIQNSHIYSELIFDGRVC